MWQESSGGGNEFFGLEGHSVRLSDRHTNRTQLWGGCLSPTGRHYASWQSDRVAQRDQQTSRPHNETGQELWGSSRNRLEGREAQQWEELSWDVRVPMTSWTPLSPSTSEGWQLQTEADMHSVPQVALIWQDEWNDHKAVSWSMYIW